MKQNRPILLAVCLLLWFVSASHGDDAAKIEFFEQKIRPVLVEKCYSCHSGSPDEVEGKLWLDSKAGWVRGGQSGPKIVPGKPEASLLLGVIQGIVKDLAMPPDEKLPTSVIADFETWIRQGAIDPRIADATSGPPQTQQLTEQEHWVYSKPVKSELPDVANKAWEKQPIDRFILSRLEDAGLSPAMEATPEQLVRRLYFDLTGLPPTPLEANSFVQAAHENRQQAFGSVEP